MAGGRTGGAGGQEAVVWEPQHLFLTFSDEDLCQRFLKENNWNIFRKDLVRLLVEPAGVPIHSNPAQEERTYNPRTVMLDLYSLGQEDQCHAIFMAPSEIPAPIEDCPNHYSTPVQNPGAPASV